MFVIKFSKSALLTSRLAVVAEIEFSAQKGKGGARDDYEIAKVPSDAGFGLYKDRGDESVLTTKLNFGDRLSVDYTDPDHYRGFTFSLSGAGKKYFVTATTSWYSGSDNSIDPSTRIPHTIETVQLACTRAT
jgi:hypothetical protein